MTASLTTIACMPLWQALVIWVAIPVSIIIGVYMGKSARRGGASK